MQLDKENKIFRVVFGDIVNESAFSFSDKTLIVIAKSYDKAAVKGLKFMNNQPKKRMVNLMGEEIEDEVGYKTKSVELISDQVIY